MNHLCKLIDGIHILSHVRITTTDLNRANNLLISFVDEFEHFYGEHNMVYNIHQLRHLGECVKRNGPLFAYSNYPTEDIMGHIVSLVKGTTDVTSQICSRYLMEKNLLVCLKKSALAQEFYEQIESKLSFSVTKKLNGSLLIGNVLKIPNLSNQDSNFIRNELNVNDDEQINEYKSVLLDCRIFFETASNSCGKRTDDSLVYDSESNCFGVIDSIITVKDQLYFFVDEKFKRTENTNSTFVTLLEETISQKKLLTCNSIRRKYAFIKFENSTAASEFPNLCERN